MAVYPACVHTLCDPAGSLFCTQLLTFVLGGSPLDCSTSPSSHFLSLESRKHAVGVFPHLHYLGIALSPLVLSAPSHFLPTLDLAYLQFLWVFFFWLFFSSLKIPLWLILHEAGLRKKGAQDGCILPVHLKFCLHRARTVSACHRFESTRCMHHSTIYVQCMHTMPFFFFYSF